ncbi:hypothetical protein KXD97_32385 (plasmid) [Mycobacterium sp. SMC-8]|uniref:3-dehydroquinate synthase family protein n=1 Tax=Mycobacterium sp. SMC-8 TaxID=2857060 RepID=UPI0021B2BE27|nr:iron-containing alcohol dehydrogenase [Mycobacterium sp. SMC-8]UXA15841.1 hypothetical protein KXD97_32385 [Mycobacterium sp. SMC-8]
MLKPLGEGAETMEAVGQRIRSVTVNFGEAVTPYVVGYDCQRDLLDEVSEAVTESETVLLVVDSAMPALVSGVETHLASSGHTICVLALEASESAKSLGTVQDLLGRALRFGLTRRTSVVAIGGGMIGNVAGMVAGLLFRGVPLLHLPTTPVAAFDAVLSRKQAVNIGAVKNAAGLFKTPTFIGVDLKWLQTVPGGLMRTGLLEMAKNVLAVRPDYGDMLIRAVRSLDGEPEQALSRLHEIGVGTKLPFLRTDADETAEALIFEYGHTIGHAIEGAADGRILHGEAVGWGMLAAADIARSHHGLSDDDHCAHDEMLEVFGIIRTRRPRIDVATVRELVRADTKRGHTAVDDNQLPMVLLSALGRPLTTDGKPLCGVDLDVIDDTINALLGR